MLRPIDQMLQTPVLSDQVAQLRTTLKQHNPKASTDAQALLDRWLLPVCAVSPYIAKTLAQFTDLLPALLESDCLAKVPARSHEKADTNVLLDELEAEYQQRLAQSTSNDPNALESLQQSVLRQFRHRHMVRILWCDLTDLLSLEQTLYELTLLAQSCVKAADQWTFDALSERFGMPCDEEKNDQRLIIIGMGKLGGFELNVSSDIDLICIYPASGSTRPTANRQKSVDNGEFFRRSVQRIGKLLNSVTAEGYVYRVDTRLRPFGESGPLVMNFQGLENYYLTQARDWERYAMIKGRALTGNDADIRELEQMITPFVYRRYLDYSAFESLRELKRKIALSVLQKSMVNNIKLGAGGIREIEFIGQAFQLVRGGQEGRLRIRPIMQVLPQLAALQLLPNDDVDRLMQAYRYLRCVENAVQLMRDEQVHSLPENEEDRLRLLCILDEPDWQTFTETLAAHQSAVSQCFNDLFASPLEAVAIDSGIEANELDAAQDLWAGLTEASISDADRQALLSDIGFDPDEAVLAGIATLSRGSFYQRLTAESQHRVDSVMPLVLMFAKEGSSPGITLGRMLQFVQAVAGRGGYLQVLREQPAALKHLVTLFSQSRWLAGFVVRQPMVIDELLTQADLHGTADEVFAETRDLIDRLHTGELDVQMDSLRHYRQAREMRIACAQLDGSLTLMQVSDQLSWLAESIIEGVVKLVQRPLVERFGNPGYEASQGRVLSHVGVLAYGKLGGLELGFSSDLDLVFVHDSVGAGQITDGKKPIDNAMFYARLAQKFVSFMSTKTPAGMLYEIDLRLRPNGSSGVLVTGIDSFGTYQQSDAWTWEHQALMRARMVLGNETLRERFNAIRHGVLARERQAGQLKDEVAKMRERMRGALGNTKPGLMHLKQDAGGVADIEFIVQYMVLAHARSHPELLAYTDNIRVLDTVESLELLPTDACQTLRNSYLNLRERLHRRALDEASALVPVDEGLTALASRISALRVQILGE